MEQSNMKSIFIIVNAGYSSEIIDIIREAGAKGASILNARGESSSHKVFMGITVDSEREIILCLVDESITDGVAGRGQGKSGLRIARAQRLLCHARGQDRRHRHIHVARGGLTPHEQAYY